MGAWIETYLKDKPSFGNTSHPMWVRGLKPVELSLFSSKLMSHPMWVRGLKLTGRDKFEASERRTLCGCVD